MKFLSFNDVRGVLHNGILDKAFDRESGVTASYLRKVSADRHGGFKPLNSEVGVIRYK